LLLLSVTAALAELANWANAAPTPAKKTRRGTPVIFIPMIFIIVCSLPDKKFWLLAAAGLLLPTRMAGSGKPGA
jgi:hypothetical protein